MGTRILLIDDDPQFRALVRPPLMARGWTVFEAASGREGSSLLERERPDLVVVDGLLPDTDGMSWIARLRAGGDEVKVVFASSFWRDRRAFERLTKELRVALVVHKPVVPSAFVAHLADQLSEQTPELDFSVDVEMDDVELSLAKLRVDYAAALPGKVSEIGDALVRAKAAGNVAEPRGLAHRLRGTAGSYGFEEVGTVAGRIEDALTALGAAPGTAATAWAQIESARQQLELAARTAHAKSQPGSTAVPAHRDERLLVVDDDPAFISLVEHLARPVMLATAGARTPAEALEEARQRLPDAALIDVNLASGDSFQLARDLRSIPGAEGLPIAFVSTDRSFESRVAASHAGGALYLEKPLDETSFGNAMQRLLASRPVRPRILVVDDDPDFRARIGAILARAGMQTVVAPDPKEILEAVEHMRPDLVVLDVNLPGVSGFDVCRLLRTTAEWRDLPLLFVTASADVTTRVAAFQAGGDDYLQKPIIAEELLARIRVRLDRVRLMREFAEKDALTGLLSRRAFAEGFSARLSEARRHERPMSMAILDLDRFKSINDDYGHLAGDRVLSTLGKLLRSRFRAADLRGRWGGEEFALAFPDEQLDTVRAVLERLLEEVKQLQFEGDQGTQFRISFSAGVAAFPEDGGSLQELLRAADRRLYAAKGGGRARVVSAG